MTQAERQLRAEVNTELARIDRKDREHRNFCLGLLLCFAGCALMLHIIGQTFFCGADFGLMLALCSARAQAVASFADERDELMGRLYEA